MHFRFSALICFVLITQSTKVIFQLVCTIGIGKQVTIFFLHQMYTALVSIHKFIYAFV
jgi:hypothetical protein